MIQLAYIVVAERLGSHMVIRVSEGDTTALNLLLEKFYRDGGHDFREYKRGTVTRRLERRLRAVGTKSYRDYMRFLDVHPEEYQRLAEDLTIKTSGFFRSLYTFQQVAKLVLPELVSYKESKGGANAFTEDWNISPYGTIPLTNKGYF